MFVHDSIVNVVVQQFLRAATVCQFEIITYCAMPDHLHVVARGLSDTASLPVFVRKAKQLSAYYGKRAAGMAIWQCGYYDRIIAITEDIRVVIAYVVRNPVRRGLVADARDYPYTGSGGMSRDELFEYVRDFL